MFFSYILSGAELVSLVSIFQLNMAESRRQLLREIRQLNQALVHAQRELQVATEVAHQRAAQIRMVLSDPSVPRALKEELLAFLASEGIYFPPLYRP